MTNLTINSTSIEIGEVNLHNGKVLTPRIMSQEKGKEVVRTDDHVRLTHDVPPLEAYWVILPMLIIIS